MTDRRDFSGDDLAALDFSAPHDNPTSDEDADGFEDLLFSVTNAAGTITVTAYLNGQLHHVELAPGIGSISESELADEIVAVAETATAKARAALHEMIAGLLRLQGQDSLSIRELLEHRMGLPTSEQAAAEESALAHHQAASSRRP